MYRPDISFTPLVFLLFLIGLLPACGQKGDLYLPDKIPEPVQAQIPEQNQTQKPNQPQDPGAGSSATDLMDVPSGESE